MIIRDCLYAHCQSVGIETLEIFKGSHLVKSGNFAGKELRIMYLPLVVENDHNFTALTYWAIEDEPDISFSNCSSLEDCQALVNRPHVVSQIVDGLCVSEVLISPEAT